MKNFFCSLALMVALGLGTLVAQTGAQTDASTTQASANSAQNPVELSQKVEELEGLVKQLQSELTAMKQQQTHVGPRGIAEIASTSMPTLPAASLAPNVEDAPAPAPEKVSLAGLLGPTTLSGFVDVFYGYNSNQPVPRVNQYHNFDINSSEIGLNMIELVADKGVSSDSRVGYHIALGFGQAMNQVNQSEVGPGGTEPNFGQNLKEAYLEYMAPIGKGLQINVGKMVTPVGAELIESKDNWNYTRGILFAYAIPYFHTGVSAKYAFNDKVALSAYLYNGWNNSTENNSGKTTGFTLAITPNSKFSFIENYLVGPEYTNDNSDYRHIADTVVTFNPTAKLSLMANFDYGRDHVPSGIVGVPSTPAWWTGIAGFIKYAPSDKWYVATRGEWFNDHDGWSTGTPQHLSEFTFTLQRMLAGKLMSRLEVRRDMSDQNTFPYRTADFMDHQNTVTLGLIYAFSSADAK
jgi:Putative beta-barrel porin-2, OmpL-like. bbp2